MLGLAVPAGLALTWWEVRLDRRGGEPVIQVGLLRAHRSFGTGQSLALLYFAGFTSLFFTLSIMWQQGLGRSALSAGLLVLPFALGALVTAANSFRFSRRFGRVTVQAGIGAIGTALFGSGPGAGGGSGSGGAGGPGGPGPGPGGSGSGGSGSGGHGGVPALMPSLVHHAGIAALVNLCFVAAALACAFGLPRRLAGDSGAKDGEKDEKEGARDEEGKASGAGRGGAAGDSGQSAA